MSRIRVLPEALANRIAAGEVVERPASVVKELAENSLDAGASRIDIELEEGGKRLVLVRDDGSGMERDDAMLAFQQHATSKIRTDEDLSAIGTCGFRGEALAAIAACARVTLVTAEADGEGTRVRVEDGVLRDVSTVGAPRGTSIEVRDLFGRLPARRKFLRAASTELAHAQRHVEHLALAHPHVHFTLRQGRPLLELAATARLADRVTQVMGAEFTAAALPIEADDAGLRVRAFLVRSDFGVGRLTQVTVLVNGRPVSDRLLAHALREAGQMLFGVDIAPAGLLMVDLPPADVDVNVHPAKREVRFARPGEVHDRVRDLLRRSAVGAGAFAPALETGPERRLAVSEPAGTWRFSPASAPGAAESLPDRQGGAATLLPFAPEQAAALAGASPARASKSCGTGGAWAPSSATPMGAGRRVLAQHRNTYVVAEDEQGLLLVDQHCAHERVLFEKVLRAMGSGVASQALLEPVVVEVPSAMVETLTERLPDLARLGLEAEPFGPSSFAIRAVPALAGTADAAELLRELAAQDVPGTEPLERVRHLAATIACKAAVKAGFPLGHERMRYLVDELMACEVPTTCPHGRVAILRLSDRDIDHRFQRI